jgi:hypothetical protein
MTREILFSISTKVFRVRDEHELALVFELAACEEAQKNILQQIGDEGLISLIKTGE